MFLCNLLLTVLGALGAYAGCPSPRLIHPCTCRVVKDNLGEEFPILSCSGIYTENVLTEVLAATRGQKLFELQIVNSTLNYIPNDAFQNTTFQVVSLENSSISALSDATVAFGGLDNHLRLLEIINCSFLTNWDWTQLSHLQNLMEIVVMQSDLLEIANGLGTVQHLGFEAFVFKESNIGWLESHVFAPFEQLTRLTLDKNRIENIQRSMFPRPANQLKIIGLSYNKLKYLPNDIFVDMPVITSLYLTGNPLQIIDEVTFKPIWNQIKLFFFYDTKLLCDCRLTWLTKKDNSRKYMHAVCYDPTNISGRDVQSIQSHELLC